MPRRPRLHRVPEPAWALEGDGARAAEIIGGEAAVRFQRLPWPELAQTALRLGEGVYVSLVLEPGRPGLELWPLAVDLPVTGLFVGGALLVAAEAFRRGAQLEEEQAFTV